MDNQLQNPLIVQGDSSLLLDVHTPLFEEARAALCAFAELEKSPEHMHTYRITPLSLWNAASAGLNEKKIEERLDQFSRFPVPENVLFFIRDTIGRFGQIVLKSTDIEDTLFLEVKNPPLREELKNIQKLKKYMVPAATGFNVPLLNRGTIKLELIKLGFPVEDRAPLKAGDPLSITLRQECLSGKPFELRPYQNDSIASLLGDKGPGTGFGTLVLPCGSGKTVIGIALMAAIGNKTLILAPNVAAVHQWRDEILDKTELTENEIGEYTGDRKEIKPVTIATYQILVWRKDKESPYPHFKLFIDHNWGLIVYDEVHLLPAPVFRVTAEIQAVKRVGLTATLVREDGAEEDVFSLVGPKRFDIPWKQMEESGWIAEAICREIRMDLPEDLRIPYATSDRRKKFRLAAENPEKLPLAVELSRRHEGDSILIIGQYLDQLKKIATLIDAPLITGQTANSVRETIYHDFREGKIKIIIVSKVANFAINLPDASVAIQLSGSFGSRQEEAQRLGRILRPKEKKSYFYTLVSRYTLEEQYSANRQKFLAEQGYKYEIGTSGDFIET